jgi:predicted DNA-binding transcriptional regulator AlpA
MEKLLTSAAVAQITGRSTSTLQKDRVAGTGIPYVKLGRLVRYRQADVERFCADRVRVRVATDASDQSAELPTNPPQ